MGDLKHSNYFIYLQRKADPPAVQREPSHGKEISPLEGQGENLSKEKGVIEMTRRGTLANVARTLVPITVVAGVLVGAWMLVFRRIH